MMNHSFDVDMAVKYGLAEAVFIENLRFWIARNKANKKHFHKGRYWTYNSAQAYSELFPYWSSGQIERIVAKLKERGVLLVDNFNDRPFDRTNWYALNDDAIPQNQGVPLPETGESLYRTDINTDTPEFFDLFWKAYPRKTGKAAALKSFQKLKVTKDMVKVMLKAINEQSRTEQWKNPQYIPHASTWLNGARWEDELIAPPSNTFNPLAGAL